MSADDEFEVASQDQLTQISILVKRALELEDQIETISLHLKELSKEYAENERELIEAIIASGTKAWEGEGGIKVKIAKSLVVQEIKDSIKRRELMKKRAIWLECNEGESMVKESIEMDFEKGDHAKAVRIMDLLASAGQQFAVSENINTASFKAFVDDMLSNGVEVPLDELGLFQKMQAKITRPKGQK